MPKKAVRSTSWNPYLLTFSGWLHSIRFGGMFGAVILISKMEVQDRLLNIAPLYGTTKGEKFGRFLDVNDFNGLLG